MKYISDYSTLIKFFTLFSLMDKKPRFICIDNLDGFDNNETSKRNLLLYLISSACDSMP